MFARQHPTKRSKPPLPVGAHRPGALLPRAEPLGQLGRLVGNRALARALDGPHDARRTAVLQRQLTGSGKDRNEDTLGPVAVDEEFALGPKKFFVLIKKAVSAGEEAKYVHDAAANTNTPYSKWIAHPWRTWQGDVQEGSGVTTTRTDRPASTDKIPLTLYKRVNVKQLESISQTGLESTLGRILYGGYSKGSVYLYRDTALAAVWLGKTTTPGESMQPGDGSYVDLTIKVGTAFRDAYLRDVYAVLHGDDNREGDSVLSFAPIPPNLLFLPVSAEMLAAIAQKGDRTRLGPGDNQMSRIEAPDIRKIRDLLSSSREEY